MGEWESGAEKMPSTVTVLCARNGTGVGWWVVGLIEASQIQETDALLNAASGRTRQKALELGNTWYMLE